MNQIRNFLEDQVLQHFDNFEIYNINPHSDLSSTENITLQKDVLIVLCYDHFIYSNLLNSNDYNYLVSETAKYVHNIAKTNSTKKIILVTENVCSDREFSQLDALDNLEVISTNGFLAIEYEDYLKLTPHTRKSKSNTTFLCLNGKPRPQRVNTVYYLIYKNLFNLGIISFLSGGWTKLDYNPHGVNDWAMPTHFKLNNFFKNLFESNNYKRFGILCEDYKTQPGNNANNFNQLRDYYEKSYVEIITVTTFVESSFRLCEKYINSIFGFVFPIFIGSHGYVQLVRDFGFDVFDDIIDHSYDNEKNPYYRLKYAIDSNNKLLRDKVFLEEKFTECIPRFEANVRHYKENLKGILESRVQKQLDNITF